jgi:hypothetical protein
VGLEGLGKLKKFNELIGTRTSNLPKYKVKYVMDRGSVKNSAALTSTM